MITKQMPRSAPRPSPLSQPFYATGAELELYQTVFDRWRTLSDDAVLTEAARLFNLAVVLVQDARRSR